MKTIAALTEGVPYVLDLVKLYYFADAYNTETSSRKQPTFRDDATDFLGKVISRGNQWRGSNFLAVFSCYIETG